MTALQQDPVLYGLNIPFFAIFFVPYAIARYTEGRAVPAGLAVTVAGMSTMVAFDPEDPGVGNLFFGVTLAVAAPFIAGRLLRTRAALARALREKAARLEAERADAAARAVEAERTRIAGELHDVVSHALSAMVVGAGAARRMTGRDPELAGQAFAAVEHTGREALAELRRLLGVLRHEDEELALAPQPSLAHLGDLARRTTRAGLPVELSTEGRPPASIPAGVDLTAYRLVQAALASARDTGQAGHATVRVRYEPDRIDVAVRDDGTVGDRGPLVGMRERVHVYGGEVHAGPRVRGGYTVRAALPLEAAT